MRAIWLARHGYRQDTDDPDWAKTASREYDPGLSENGFVQAKELALRLSKEPIAHIFSSPFLRAVQTADSVAEAMDLDIKIEEGFCEWLNSNWFSCKPNWLPLKHLSRKFPRVDTTYGSSVSVPHPEPPENVSRRIALATNHVLENFEGDILVVGHGATLMGMTKAFVLDPPRITCPLCSIIKLVLHESAWKIELVDETSHLSQGAQRPCI